MQNRDQAATMLETVAAALRAGHLEQIRLTYDGARMSIECTPKQPSHASLESARHERALAASL